MAQRTEENEAGAGDSRSTATPNGVPPAISHRNTRPTWATVEGPFASVQATWAGPEAPDVAPAFQLLRDGVATFDGLRPGRWKIVLSTMGQPQGEPRFAEVAAGQTAEVSF